MEVSHRKIKSVTQNLDKRIGAAVVRTLCGGISDMSLWRWLSDPYISFPRPIYIGRRRYWKEVEIIAWLDARPTEQHLI